MCFKISKSAGGIGLNPLHSSDGKFHCRHECQWGVERSRSHASRLQRDGALRRSGRQQTSRRIRHLLGFEKEHGKGGGSRARFLLRSLDTGSLYETRRGEWEVVAHVSGRMSGIGRRLGRRLWGIIYEVRIGVSLFIYLFIVSVDMRRRGEAGKLSVLRSFGSLYWRLRRKREGLIFCMRAIERTISKWVQIGSIRQFDDLIFYI